MKFENKTLDLLKSFSSINPSIIINEGDILRTISPSKAVIAKAKSPQSFEHQMAIYDLSNFMSALSMFEDASINYNSEENEAVISSGKEDNSGKIRYKFTHPSNIIAPPSGDIKITNPFISFNLKNKSINSALKALGILNLPNIAIVGDGKHLTIQATDSKKEVSNYHEVIGETDKKFKAYVSADNMKMIPNDYDVSIVQIKDRVVAHFHNKDVEYWIALEQNSEFI